MQALTHTHAHFSVLALPAACTSMCICVGVCLCVHMWHDSQRPAKLRPPAGLSSRPDSKSVCVCSSTYVRVINSATVLHIYPRLFLLPCVVNWNILPSPSSFTSILNSSLPCYKMLSVRFPLINHSAELKPTELVWFVYLAFCVVAAKDACEY